MKRHRITIVQANGLLSVYLNNHRIAGEKPWGGGKVVETLVAEDDDLREGLKRPAIRSKPSTLKVDP